MRQCEICGKGSILRAARIKLRGNYNPTPKKRKSPNLQPMRLLGRRVTACVKCSKTIAKKMASV